MQYYIIVTEIKVNILCKKTYRKEEHLYKTTVIRYVYLKYTVYLS